MKKFKTFASCLTLVLMIATTAQAADLVEDFTLNSGGNVEIAPAPGASIGLIDTAGIVFDWGGFNTNPANPIRYNGTNGLQFHTGKTAGSYALTTFASGGVGPYSGLTGIVLDVSQGGGTNFDRILVRNGGAWWASEVLDLPSAETVHLVESLEWFSVTNAASAIEAAISTPALFEALNISSAATTWAGTGITTIDGGGLYIEVTGTNRFRIPVITWSDAIFIIVPDLTGQDLATASTSITGLGLTVGTTTAQQNSDAFAAGFVVESDPTEGGGLTAGGVVNLAFSAGPDQYWDFTNAGGGDLADVANYAVVGSDVDGTEAAYAPAFNITERLIIQNGTTPTLNTGTLEVSQVKVSGGSEIDINGGTLMLNRAQVVNGLDADGDVNNVQRQNLVIGQGEPAGVGSGVGEVTLISGSILDRGGQTDPEVNDDRGGITIGSDSANGSAGTGTLTISGGTIDVYEIDVGGADSAGTLILDGPGGSVSCWDNFGFASDSAVLRYVAHAAGFPQTVTADIVILAAGTIEIDLSALPDPTIPVQFTLLTAITTLDNGGGLDSTAAITPTAGTNASDWQVTVQGNSLILNGVPTPPDVTGVKAWNLYE